MQRCSDVYLPILVDHIAFESFCFMLHTTHGHTDHKRRRTHTGPHIPFDVKCSPIVSILGLIISFIILSF